MSRGFSNIYAKIFDFFDYIRFYLHKNGFYKYIYTILQLIDRALERLEKRLLADRVDFEEHRLTSARRDARQMDLVAVGQKRERKAHPISAEGAVAFVYPHEQMGFADRKRAFVLKRR